MLEILLDVLKTNKMDYTFWFGGWMAIGVSIMLMLLTILNMEKLGIFKLLILRLSFFIVVVSIIVTGYTNISKKRAGATCKDGWYSYSSGPGTCSSHGGVETWKFEYWFDK